MKILCNRTLRVVASLILPGAFLLSFSARAQDGAAALPATVVTATRTEQPLTDLVADVTVIDRAEIERSGAGGLADVLARVPGIEMLRNGGPGNNTNLFVRGAETQFTAVYIDGVRVDSQTTSGGAVWESIPLAQIDRVEVLRGPASAVYGSDALGGVIQIFTRRGQGPFTPFAGIGLGTYGTRRWEGGFSGKQEKVDYAFSLAREASSGFNVRPVAGYNPDDDGYVNESVSGRLGWQLNDAHRLEATVLSSNLDAQYDSSKTAPSSTYDDHILHLLQTKGLNWQARWSDTYRTRVALTESRDQVETKPTGQPTSSMAMTRLNGYLWHNEWRIGAHQMTAALERRSDYLENGLGLSSTSSAFARDRSQDALALGYGWRAGRHTLQANARHDQDSEFGGQDTGSLAYGFALTPQWRATASVGTAFRAPTLYQRFSIYGLSTLQPQTSTNWEAGLRYLAGTSQFDAVLYRNLVNNLVTFSSSATGCASGGNGCYASTAQAEYAGITLSARQRVAAVNLRAALDVQNPRDAITGNLLPRRAVQHLNLGADTRLGAWSVGGGAQLSGARFDDAANTVALPGYALLHLFASTALNKDWTLLARIDNLTDSPYQLANGYATPGRSLYAALKWQPH